jgi:CRP-like cAMP-binding protein
VVSPELPIPNLFLASLARDDYEFLQPHLERVDLPLKKILFEAGRAAGHCYFSDAGMISLVVPLEDGVLVEAGVVGKEGFAGGSALIGEMPAPHTGMVQIPGEGARVRPARVREAIRRSPAFLHAVLRFSQALGTQIAQTAACNARHDVQERLARWLLMAHDRAESDHLPLTQEFISIMLGVRRSGVTVAARALQSAGAIEYRRGSIEVRDRALLEQASCECYADVRAHYERLLGWPAG